MMRKVPTGSTAQSVHVGVTRNTAVEVLAVFVDVDLTVGIAVAIANSDVTVLLHA